MKTMIGIILLSLSSIVLADDGSSMVKQHMYEAQSKVEAQRASEQKTAPPYNEVKMHPKKEGVKMHPKKEGVKMHKPHGSGGVVRE